MKTIFKQVEEYVDNNYDRERTIKSIRTFGPESEQQEKRIQYKKQWVRRYHAYLDDVVKERMKVFYGPPEQIKETARIMGKEREESNKQNKRIEYQVEISFKLEDLRSRMNSFLYIGIELPTDDLLKVIISKTLSDNQISINPKISEYIINNVERSYKKMFKFLKDVDELSLSTGKSININLIKKVLDQ